MQRERFSFAASFLQPFNPVFKQGLKSQSVNLSPQNAAFSEFLNYALLGEYPDYVLISKIWFLPKEVFR